VPVSVASEDDTVELMERLFGRPACVETDLEAGITHASVFLEEAPSRKELKVALPRFTVRKLAPQNWAESWKRHFKPIEIGAKLLIKPSWIRRKARSDQRVIILNPGLSFGTGQHPTTRFCLEQIVAFRDEQRVQSFLDVGTGSGILAIAAVKLGYKPVRGFDFDPVAVRIARANAAGNRVADRVRLFCKDVAAENSPKQYDLICANLLADLLLVQRDRLISWLKPGSRLVVAGILKSQFRNIEIAYQTVGLRQIASASEKEWKSAAFSL